MSKTKKKRNLKLRRQIRKTAGALFMASAIVVAALPVQDLSAETLKVDEVIKDERKSIRYPDNLAGEGLDLDTENLLNKKDTADIYPSYYVRQLSNGSWSLSWQFKYYVVPTAGSSYAIVSEYNDLYSEDQVTLSNTANAGYKIVTTDEYENFFKGLKSDGTTPYPAAEKAIQERRMSYQDYVDCYDDHGTGTWTSDMEWINTYRPSNFEAYINACRTYYDSLAAYNKYLTEKAAYDEAYANYQALPDKTGVEVPVAPASVTDPGSAPADISFNPSTDFSNDEKYSYYCDWNPDITQYGSGYSLLSVTDNTSETGSSTAKNVYLVKGGSPIGNAYNDANGFLVTEASTNVIGIGNGAFAGVSNVNELSLPNELKYIGDEAFKGSFIKSITMSNVENIGNHAFEDCTELSTVKLSGTKKIGTECFKNSGITSVQFPYSLSEIGPGAFAECRKLTNVDLSAVNTECEIAEYAFFNDYALNNVSMADTGITSLGEGAFALSSTPTGEWVNVSLPNLITAQNGLGDLLLAGRSNLKTVKLPDNYGTNSKVTLKNGIFKGCAALEYVDFTAKAGSIINGNVEFDTFLFIDVTNPDFYVKGPEKNLEGQTALPRESTWAAFTRVSNYVPYVYIDSQNVECYETSDGTYLLQANENGELTSCELIDKSTNKPIDLLIPSTVGNYAVKTISEDCFSEQKLRNLIRSITIEDDSLTSLDNSVFEGLPNLEEVEIGNSVNSIGDRAFADCPKLENVTFHTPSIGYADFSIGDEAFKTGSNELTLHGDIVPGYAPFDFALGKESGKIDDNGKRICYKSLPPESLTVMYDNETGDVTLLDYPKYNELDDRNQEHNSAMEKYYTQKYGSDASIYDSYRESFAKQWLAASDDERTELYDSIDYGPWIDSDFLNRQVEIKDDAGTVIYLSKYDQYMTEAGVTVDPPLAYYTRNHYSILENYERGSNVNAEYETVTDEELQWINACLNIVVPSGVTSIDSTAFFNATANARNVSTYFGTDDEGYKSYVMSTKNGGGAEDVVPGLFSGFYDDYEEASEYEKKEKGNDRILSITLNDVKKLPDYAFDSCERLQNVSLGDDLSDIGTAPFRGCGTMTDIAGNDYYAIENRIIYSVNDDGTYTIEECLPSRGANGSSPIVISSSDPKLVEVSSMKEGAFEDCDSLVKVYLDDANLLKVIPKNAFNDCDSLNEVGLSESVNRIEEDAFGGNESIEVTIPGYEVDIVTDAFEHVSTNTINTYENTSAWDYGKYYGLNVEKISDSYTVTFLDYDGTEIAVVHNIVSGMSVPDDDVPANPTRTGFTFTGWSGSYHNVTENRMLIAQYTDNSGSANRHKVVFYTYDGATVVSTQYVDDGGAATAPIPPTRSGYSFVAWVPDTYTNVTQDLNIVASYEVDSSTNASASPTASGSASPTATASGSSSSSSSSASATPSATPSSSSSSTKMYTVSVSGGSGSGSYAAGAVVAINAYYMGEGQAFEKWTTSTAGVGFANAEASSTTFTMPAANVAITATYKTGNGTTTTASNVSTSTGTTGTSSNNGTTVDITKPGFSNTGLAGATVSGATDNFIVRISEDPNATAAAIAALQARYGDISRIQYFPMDISLYDSTGRTKIADTTGISVDITLPIPDELVQYAGNNKIASAAGNQLEDLNSRFTTVNGVPCISFTATHFSPYVLYVDTANLTAGTIDATPKTGDPIHPKWFLALGLACVSLILFFKKDKRVAIA